MNSSESFNRVSRSAGHELIPAMVLPLDPTGVPQLDMVLGGGLRRGSLMLLVGPPGGGKTTLAGQLAFSAAKAGRRVLMLAALSEPVTKMISHLRAFDFYDESLVGEQIRIHSLQQFLPQGLASTGRELASIVRAEQARLVVLDGFSGLRTADGPQAVRRFLYELGTALSLQGATTVITSEGNAHDPALFGETTTADAIIAVETTRINVRASRWLEVVKARGTSPILGRHGLTITRSGITVHPRLEVQAGEDAAGRDPLQTAVDASPAAPPAVSFGQDAIDDLLRGGVTRDSTTLVVGRRSSGKTLLGLHFALAGAQANEPTVFLSLRQSPDQLRRTCAAFAMESRLARAIGPEGSLDLLWYPPVELDIDVLADTLVATLDRTNARRLVIDGIDEWERAVREGSDESRIPNHLAALVSVLHQRQVAALLIREERGTPASGSGTDAPIDTLGSLAENVIMLGDVVNKGRTHRILRLPKLRFAPQDAKLHEFVIEAPDGFRLLGEFSSDGGILEAIAHEEASQVQHATDTTPAPPAPPSPQPASSERGGNQTVTDVPPLPQMTDPGAEGA